MFYVWICFSYKIILIHIKFGLNNLKAFMMLHNETCDSSSHSISIMTHYSSYDRRWHCPICTKFHMFCKSPILRGCLVAQRASHEQGCVLAAVSPGLIPPCDLLLHVLSSLSPQCPVHSSAVYQRQRHKKKSPILRKMTCQLPVIQTAPPTGNKFVWQSSYDLYHIVM